MKFENRINQLMEKDKAIEEINKLFKESKQTETLLNDIRYELTNVKNDLDNMNIGEAKYKIDEITKRIETTLNDIEKQYEVNKNEKDDINND